MIKLDNQFIRVSDGSDIGPRDYYGNYDLNLKGIMMGDLALYVKTKSDLENTKGSITQNYMPDSMTVPAIPQVVSCHLFPYLEKKDLKLWQTKFDSDRLTIPVSGQMNGVELYRIRDINEGKETKDVATFKKYKVSGTSIGGKFKWQNEGKLWLPPYQHIVLDDNLSEPITLYPNLIKDNSTEFTLKVRHTLNHLGVYTLFVNNFLGDTTGLRNGSTVPGLRMPNASDVYSDYMNRNRNQLKQKKNEQFVSGLMGVGLVAGGLAKGDMSMATNGAMMTYNTLNSINQQKATERDLMNAGTTLTYEGSDISHGIQMAEGMKAYYMSYPDEILERIGWYFQMFGYTQNNVMKPNLRSRHYFNYIKTGGVNIKAEGVPKEHFLKLKAIYNNGTTIWHMDREGVVVGDYSNDNYEV